MRLPSIARLDSTVVLDTNVVISGLLFRRSTPRFALEKAFRDGKVLSSPSIRNEMREVLGRPKFDRYVPREVRMGNLEELIDDMEAVHVLKRIRLCRDNKDDKFLELAFAGDAEYLITGDANLLALHPFRGTAILTAAAYLAR